MELHLPSFQVIFSFLLVFLVIIFKSLNKSKTKGSPKNLPPSPSKLPLIGHLHHLSSGLPHQRLRELAIKHGPLMHLKLGELSHVVVSSPEAAKEVMKTHDINFANRPLAISAKVILYDFTDIAFAPYGAYWRQLRKICTLELLSTRRVQSFRVIREEHVANLIRSISSNAGLPVNVGDLLTKASHSILLTAAFAGRFKQHEAFVTLMKRILEQTSGFSISDLYPSIKFLHLITGTKAKLQRLRREFDPIFDSIIEEHRASKANPKNSDDGVTDDLVDVLLNLQDNGVLEFPLTNDNIKAVILDMIIGGTETNSTTSEWAMSEMMRNPETLEKAQAEVRQVFDKTGEVEESRLHELKYLKLVIKETLRLHPPVPLLLPRENVEGCEIDGYEIPAKTKVIVNAWAIGRDPNHWHEAERFNPERFLESSIDFKGTNFEFIPFGAGRRICPGIIFGMAVVELFLAKLLYHFDWKLPNGIRPEELDMSEALSATVGRKNDLHLIPIPYTPHHG